MFKAKILIVGPCESGKTVISNFLADATEISSGEYYPTQGVRILEFEAEGITTPDRRTANVEVELWDCSGDNRFENCWPAIQKDTSGVIFVYNPDQQRQSTDLEKWHLHFAKQLGIRDGQILVFAHHKPGSTDSNKTNLSGAFSRIRVIHTNLDDDADQVKDVFRSFLGNILVNLTDKRDEEELSIVNQR